MEIYYNTYYHNFGTTSDGGQILYDNKVKPNHTQYADRLRQQPLPQQVKEETSVGIDVGLKDFATLSTGEKIANPRFLKKSLKRLKRLSHQNSKKKKGSNNRDKSRLRLARQHEKVKNQRIDFLQQVSTRIVRENQTVCVEDLNIQGMQKNRKLSRAIADVSWGSFLNMLKYKAERVGKNYVEIGRFQPSSRLCTCGVVNKELTLRDRTWTCKSCHATHDRDILAAQNIKMFALIKVKIGRDTPESTLGEIAVRESLNQESPG